ncbi:MAG: 5'/3'-nucleotidase SurE [Clostridia bacterium]|nr:5'/3'-nucleotidase SurE [Clostridia bacterium]
MNILITNDDGMDSPILPGLIRWARKLGNVTAVVPRTEQSGMSQAVNFTQEVEVKKETVAPDVTVYAVDSTPADCVRFGITALNEDYRLIISGINKGYNLGDDIVYSGTVGAIFEGSRLGIRGLALSSGREAGLAPLEHLDKVWGFICENRLFEHCSLYNVNIPSNAKGFRITAQGGMFFSDVFKPCGENKYIQVGEPLPRERNDLSFDIDAIRNGYISVTPLIATRTDLSVFERLKTAVND